MEGLPGDIGPPGERSLEAWLENLGADISALRVADFSDGVRGLEATRDLAEGEFALTVPLDACIIDDGHANFPEGWGILQWQGRTAYRLAVEKAKGSASRWHPYIAMLPSKPPRVPARWSEEELEELQDPWLAAEAESLTMWSDELYDEASRLPPPPGCEGCSVPTKDEFLWALDTLQSRTIRIDREDGGWEGTPLETPSGGGGVTEDGGWVGEGDGTIRALVPWLDMLNHSPESENFFSLKQVPFAMPFAQNSFAGFVHSSSHLRDEENLFPLFLDVDQGAHNVVAHIIRPRRLSDFFLVWCRGQELCRSKWAKL